MAFADWCRAAFAALLLGVAVGAASEPRWTLVEVRQAFIAADTDRDGVLTRAEAQALAILPRSFEDMDANKDGVLTQQEYENGVAAS